jgi:hypothetical protein
MTAADRQPRTADSIGGAGRHGAVAPWGIFVAACAVCCAGPLLAALAAVGVSAGVAAVAVPALAVVAVAALGGGWWLRHRARARCGSSSTAAHDRADLGIPVVGPRDAA